MTATSGAIPAPTSMEDVERLVQSLYTPALPANVYAEIQSLLVPLQRNADGWRLAEYLLRREDPNVKFFGANTYIVKMNSDWGSLDEVAILELEAQLVQWLISISQQPNPPNHVVKKLSTALALYYAMGRNVNADEAVKTVVCSSLRGEYLGREQINMFSTSNLAPMLDRKQLKVVLQFIEDYATESRKLLQGYPVEIIAACSSRAAANLEDAICVLQTTLFLGQAAEVPAEAASLCDVAMISFHNLVNFGLIAWQRDSEHMDLLRTLVEPALLYTANTDGTEAVVILQEMLESHKSFFRPVHLHLIAQLLDSQWANEKMEMIMHGDPDAEPFLLLLISFGLATLEHIGNSSEDEGVSRLLEKLHVSATIPDVPGIDEEAGAREVLQFWAEYLENALELQGDHESEEGAGPEPPVLQAMKAHIARVADIFSRKLRFPKSEDAREIGKQQVDVFKEFRRDVKDFLEGAFRLLGDPFLEQTIEQCHAAISGEMPDWSQFEAALYCLNALSDEIPPDADRILDGLFKSPLFSTLASTNVPYWACRTSLETVSKFSKYFERHPDQLPAIFEFLFTTLKAPSFARQSATSIFDLCGSCSTELHLYFDRLVEVYQDFLGWETAQGNTYTKEKFIGAITSILQAFQSRNQQVTGLLKLLEYVENDCAAGYAADRESHRLQSTNPPDEALQAAEIAVVKVLEALHCLRGMGRAMQSPGDDRSVIAINDTSNPDDFWTAREGAVVQQNIKLKLSNILQQFGAHSDCVDLACDVLRSGFPESEPGPFVFPANTIVDFISTAEIHGPGIMSILNMAQALPRAYTEPRIDTALTAMLTHMLWLMKCFVDPRTEPEVSESLLRVFESCMPRYTNVILEIQPPEDLEALFRFAGATLTIPEPLTKRAAASFWETFLSQTPQPPHTSQEVLDEIVNHFASSLAFALMSQIAGDALRSDLEQLSRLIFRFLRRVNNARAMFEQALASVRNPEAQKPEVRRVFVAQLGVAKSVGKTREICLDFWGRCNGIPAYTN